jgi:hypothetical protein
MKRHHLKYHEKRREEKGGEGDGRERMVGRGETRREGEGEEEREGKGGEMNRWKRSEEKVK